MAGFFEALKVITYIVIGMLLFFSAFMFFLGGSAMHNRKVKDHVSIPLARVLYYALLPKKVSHKRVHERLYKVLRDFRRAQWSLAAGGVLIFIVFLF